MEIQVFCCWILSVQPKTEFLFCNNNFVTKKSFTVIDNFKKRQKRRFSISETSNFKNYFCYNTFQMGAFPLFIFLLLKAFRAIFQNFLWMCYAWEWWIMDVITVMDAPLRAVQKRKCRPKKFFLLLSTHNYRFFFWDGSLVSHFPFPVRNGAFITEFAIKAFSS